jgi:hypothetical protein
MRCCFKAGQHHKACSFARPRWAKHCQKFTFVDGEVQVLNDKRFAIVAFLNAFKRDKGLCSRSIRHSGWLPELRNRSFFGAVWARRETKQVRFASATLPFGIPPKTLCVVLYTPPQAKPDFCLES